MFARSAKFDISWLFLKSDKVYNNQNLFAEVNLSLDLH